MIYSDWKKSRGFEPIIFFVWVDEKVTFEILLYYLFIYYLQEKIILTRSFSYLFYFPW